MNRRNLHRALHVAFTLTLVWGLASSARAQRAPYLQSTTPTSTVVAWLDASPTPDGVCYGASPDALSMRAGSASTSGQHAVRVTGLSAGTRYYYAAGHASCPPPLAGNPADYFETSPEPGSDERFRVWVVGDSGTGSTRQRAVRDSMLAETAADPVDLFLHVGDMAYADGTTSQFTSYFFDIYREVLRHVPVWPTIGNHEGHSSTSSTQSGPYYEAYVLPTDGSAGGLASGTEAYYSFDYADVHFVVLDSEGSSRSPAGAMLTWLEADLAATDARWIISYWHHPPYTDGSHDSDRESQLVQMRENVLPILEAHAVDLVLTGHSHIYERSYLVRGAFDTPTTAAGHITDMGDGRLDGDGAYASGPGGTVHVVAGHGGTGVSGSGNHPLMFFSEVANGSCIIDVDGPLLTLRNLRYDGVETDHVSLIKGDGLFLLSPRGGETFLAGSIIPIVWSSVGAIAQVRVEVSLDDGASWSTAAARTDDDGLFEWDSPAWELPAVRVRISDADDATRVDESGAFALTASAPTLAIPFGSTWQYSDDDTDEGDTWRRGEGAMWPEGPAQLGYGEGDEATSLMDVSPAIPTVYFRRSIDVAGTVDEATLRVLYDDGIAVWINGTLAFERNVADGLAHGTYASSSSDDNMRESASIDASLFVPGENWIAAIVKQTSATSSDLSFDLELELSVRVTLDPPDAGTDGGGLVLVDGALVPADGGGTTTTPPGEESGCGCRAQGHERSARPFVGAALLFALIAWRRRRA